MGRVSHLTMKHRLRDWVRPWVKRVLPQDAYLHLSYHGVKGHLSACGKGTYIDPTVQILGSEFVQIGKDCVFGEQCFININDRMQGVVRMSVGDCCYFNRRCFFSVGRLIDIGSYCLAGLDCRFIGSSHMATNPILPHVKVPAKVDDVIRLGVNVFVGTNATIIGNLSIGWGSSIGASAVVHESIPPFSVVVGNPAKIVRRYSFKRQAWLREVELESGDLEQNPTEEEYLTLLRNNTTSLELPVIAATSRFGNL